MRAAVLWIPLVLAATSSQAEGLLLQKLGGSDSRMALPTQHSFPLQHRADDPPLLGPEPAVPGSASLGFSIGPFRAEAGDDFRPGHRRHLAPRYRLDGVSVLGGSVGGTLNGRGGMITLQWQSSP
jgi:hypothetical protein